LNKPEKSNLGCLGQQSPNNGAWVKHDPRTDCIPSQRHRYSQLRKNSIQ